jgi:hypothetical protein
MWHKLFGSQAAEAEKEEEEEIRVLYVTKSAPTQFFPQRVSVQMGGGFFATREAVAGLLLTPLCDIDFVVPHALANGIVLWTDLRDPICGILMRIQEDGRGFVGILIDEEDDQSIDITWPHQLPPPEALQPAPQLPVADNNSNTLVAAEGVAKRARRSRNGGGGGATRHK